MPEQKQGESAWILEAAEQFVQSRNWDKALAAFGHAREVGGDTERVLYGTGVALFFKNDLAAAKSKFEAVLRLSANPNAYYYLGQIAERQEQPNDAESLYRKAIELSPAHGGAKARLTTLGAAHNDIHMNVVHDPVPIAHQPPSNLPNVPPDVRVQNATPFGFLELLKRDQTPLAQEAVRLIEATQFSTTPLLSAHIGSLLTWFVAIIGIAYIAMMFCLSNPRQFGRDQGTVQMLILFLAVLSLCAFILPTIIRVKTTKIVFGGGRVEITAGIFTRHTENIELYRVEDLHIEQTFVNRITGDASLVFDVGGGHKAEEEIELKGLAKFRDMQNFFANLRSLILILRTGPWGHGVIY